MKRSRERGGAGRHASWTRGGSNSRTKAEWAGIGPGDAFKPELDYYVRLPAERMFYRATRLVQEEAARHAGVPVGRGFKPNILPQIGACYSGYPASLAASAAMGLTAYLEFESRATGNVFGADVVDATRKALFPLRENRASAGLLKIIVLVRDCVQKRLFLADLASSDALGSIEIYRLFAAAHQPMSFEALPDIVAGVVLFGDILPPWDRLTLHPLTGTVLERLSAASKPYVERLGHCPSDQYYDLGREWIVVLCRCLLRFVPPEFILHSTRTDLVTNAAAKLIGPPSQDEPRRAGDAAIPPLNSPRRPSLFKSPQSSDGIALAYLERLPLQDRKLDAVKTAIGVRTGLQDLKDRLDAFDDVLSRSWKQKSDWEDMRSDILVRILAATAFTKGPIEGDPAIGHRLSVSLGDKKGFRGSVFDRAIKCSEDSKRCEKLMRDARTSTEAMKDILYPNREMRPVVERIRTRGAIDPARLALSGFSPAVFKVNRLHERLDRRGSPVVAIACDGSGSLRAKQMQTLKLLAASWIDSTAKTDVRMLAGLYTSDHIRNGMIAPVVDWIYHPHKTPPTSRTDAMRAVAALPESGRGAQSDALSIAFIMEEARKMAQGRMIYLILLTDCAWNRSFNTHRSGYDEVRSLFETLYRDFREKLHVTLVGLAGSDPTGLDDLLDKVIAISEAELNDSAAVAGKIGTYVASCVRERNGG